MKKLLYLILTAFLLPVFTACTEDFNEDIASPQSYPQEDQQSVDGFSFTLGAGLASAIVLTEEDLENETVLEAITTTATPEMAEDAYLTFKLEASDTQEFSSSVELPSISENNAASITASDLDEVVKSLFGKAPTARELFIRVNYYIIDGNSSVLMPNQAILEPVTVTPVSSVIEEAYYLIGDINGWSFENLDEYAFSHSGKDVYEDPVFSLLVNNVQGNFKIVPKSAKEAASWDGVLGIAEDGNTNLTGTLGGDGAIKVEESGWVKITLNMLEQTYTIEIIGEMNLTLYVPGSHQGWSPDTAPTLYSRNFDFTYDGYVYFSEASEFKFVTGPGWDGINYGNGGEGILSSDGSAGNLSVSEAGYYKLYADLSGSPYTYSTVKTEWGLIGDATEGGWDNSTPMSYDPETNKWTVTTTLTEGNSFKFRANNGWDINLGGDPDNLTYGGDNITVAEGGTCLVTLDLSAPSTYKCSITKQ